MKILVADDEEITRFMLEEVLSEMGHEVVSVSDGALAWEALSTDPDLRMALLDWVMPGKSGVEVAERVKKDLGGNGRYVYVIMISQRDSTVDLVKAMDAGADDYIAKPVDMRELRVRIISGIRLIDLHDQLMAARIDQEKINVELRKAHEELEYRVAMRTTELAESNRKLRLSEETFRAIFESAEDWMFVKDANGRFTQANAAFLNAYGLERDQVIGKTLKDFWNPEEVESLEEVDSRVIAGDTVNHQFRAEVRGRRVVAEFVRAPLRDDSNTVIGMCGIGRDVTDRVGGAAGNDLAHPGYLSKKYKSLATRSALEKIQLASRSDSTVLLLGESGAGKDFLAGHLHQCSKRASGPFFVLNCAALPEGLAEAELFGHEKGAFTGADRRKRGLLELAEGGTLLLNEVGELSPPMQAKLLTFLDTHKFTRVGGVNNMSVNARIIAATNRDLNEEVDEGRFRKDLLYRLDVFAIRVPPLRDRIEDLPILVSDLLGELRRKLGLVGTPSVPDSAMATLKAYAWPGNIRELKNVLERALILGRGRDVTSDLLELTVMRSFGKEDAGFRISEDPSEWPAMAEALDKLKIFMITEALERTAGNVKEAASILGVPRPTLSNNITKFGIEKPRGS